MTKHQLLHIAKNERLSSIPENQKIKLTIKDWKGILNADELKISIAVALNHCAEKYRMQLLGYLITYKEVSLIIQGKAKHVEHILAKFYTDLVATVANHLKVTDTQGHVLRNWKKYEAGSLSDLFDKGVLHDPNLISLLLGQSIDLPFYSAEAEALKQKIRTYDFCSAIDYTGADGPIKVKTSWNKKGVEK